MSKEIFIYQVWSKDFYESKSKMFPGEGEFKGKFIALDENDLKTQLREKGINPNECKWEYEGQFDD